jgi:hypothetical protein
MAKEQVVGNLAHGGSSGICVTSNGEEQLMLGGGDPRRTGPLFTPVFEQSNTRSNGEQSRVDVV